MDGAPPVANTPRAWDVVRVGFPFADAETIKHRPALVIAALPAGGDFAVLWLLMITSARRTAWAGDVEITDLPRGVLTRACVVRTSKVAALDASLAVTIGRRAAVDRRKVVAALRVTLDEVLTG